MLLGEHTIQKPTLDDSLISGLQKYPNANAEFFGSKSAKPPTPKIIKRLVLILLAANILMHAVVFASQDESQSNPIILGRLRIFDDGQLALYDDHLWSAMPLHPPVD